MAVKPIKTSKPASNPAASNDLTAEELAIIERTPGRDKTAPAKDKPSLKSSRFFVYMDEELLGRIDRECKRRGGIGRSVLLRLLAAEHLPE